MITRLFSEIMNSVSLAIDASASVLKQEGDHAINIMNRGFHTQITTEFDGLLKDSACTFCGQCVQTCPTGALGDKKALRHAESGFANPYYRGGYSENANNLSVLWGWVFR